MRTMQAVAAVLLLTAAWQAEAVDLHAAEQSRQARQARADADRRAPCVAGGFPPAGRRAERAARDHGKADVRSPSAAPTGALVGVVAGLAPGWRTHASRRQSNAATAAAAAPARRVGRGVVSAAGRHLQSEFARRGVALSGTAAPCRGRSRRRGGSEVTATHERTRAGVAAAAASLSRPATVLLDISDGRGLQHGGVVSSLHRYKMWWWGLVGEVGHTD